jgi:hypothetical protein
MGDQQRDHVVYTPVGDVGREQGARRLLGQQHNDHGLDNAETARNVTDHPGDDGKCEHAKKA